MGLLRSAKYFSIGMIVSLIAISGCSLLSTNRVAVGEGNSEKKQQMVPKEQYDELLKRYEMLNRNYDDKGVPSDPIEKSEQAPLIKHDSVTIDPSAIDPQLAKDINSVPSKEQNEKPKLIETVDVFANEEKQPETTKKILKSSEELSDTKKVDNKILAAPVIMADNKNNRIEDDVKKLKEAINFLDSGKNDSALKLLQELEKSNGPQIVVRAKYYIGELLFKQNEFDLAQQIFEEVINKYAFSGMVIDSLKMLVKCCEKLGLESKKAQYESMLKDIFERKM